ncbi:MAG: potassium transporter TrkG [Phycisphaerae bacterium]
MQISYKNNRLEKFLVAINAVTAAVVAATFAMLFGFDKPIFPRHILFTMQAFLLCVFIIEKFIRFLNASSKLECLRFFWFEIPLLVGLAAAIFGAGRWFGLEQPVIIRQSSIAIYLVLQVITKTCRSVVNLTASGGNPTVTLIASFVVLIIGGTLMLMLPKSTTSGDMKVVDALFTATSATCVTGLIVKDTGSDFTIMGQVVILTLIQLGGLGIVVFGAVFALILGQAFSVRESVAMQDLLSAKTLDQIGLIIAFIIAVTLAFEAVGAIALVGMWDNSFEWTGATGQKWFYSIFHSVSAFCNAGFSLFDNSLIGYRNSWQIYAVICPLIILGGLGFGVLYDLFAVLVDQIRRFFKKRLDKNAAIFMEAPIRLRLQSKVVLLVSASLIILGAVGILIFEHTTGGGAETDDGFRGALFQSITSRTAGFNTVDIGELSVVTRFILIILMFIGGSPGSAAGGIKTVTLAVILMTAIATLRKRNEVEMFKRSIRLVIIGRAVTVILLFLAMLISATLILSITERNSNFDMSQILFEAASALGTVGLTTGITGDLTTAGKIIIIMTMLIGRLGPLTLLAALTFNLKPAKYNYPEESLIVG